MKKSKITIVCLFVTLLLLVIFSERVAGQNAKQIKDKDGNIYRTAKIGNQVWMAQNLNVSHFRNGDPIPEAKTTEEWKKAGDEKKPAWCYYDNDSENGKKYGRLYNWYAVNDSRGLAPEGWHVSSDEEWSKLRDYLGGDSIAGNKMKSTDGWSKNGNGTDKSGFSGLPGGARNANGYFNSISDYGYWWTTREYETDYAWGRGLYYFGSDVDKGYDDKQSGLSVRCVKD